MKTGDAIAQILKREGVEWIIGYPVNHILEHGAAAGIRPIVVRQERIGLHMADAIARVTSGRKTGMFGPTVSRVNWAISRERRIRFSKLPPYSSVRWLDEVLRKEDSRYP